MSKSAGAYKNFTLYCLSSFVFISVGEIIRPEGTPTRTRKPLDLPIGLMMQPTINKDSGETESKLQEIMKMTGILSINGKVRLRC